jgi:hypothetical protein
MTGTRNCGLVIAGSRGAIEHVFEGRWLFATDRLRTAFHHLNCHPQYGVGARSITMVVAGPLTLLCDCALAPWLGRPRLRGAGGRLSFWLLIVSLAWAGVLVLVLLAWRRHARRAP